MDTYDNQAVFAEHISPEAEEAYRAYDELFDRLALIYSPTALRILLTAWRAECSLYGGTQEERDMRAVERQHAAAVGKLRRHQQGFC